MRAWLRNDLDTALLTLKEAQVSDPDQVELIETAARLEMYRGRYRRAIEWWNRLERDAGYAPYLAGRAMARMELADLLSRRGEDPLSLVRTARSDLLRATRFDPRIRVRLAGLLTHCDRLLDGGLHPR